MDEERFKAALSAARDAFWDKVLECYPEAESGDLSAELTLEFLGSTQRSLRQWVEYNVPGGGR